MHRLAFMPTFIYLYSKIFIFKARHENSRNLPHFPLRRSFVNASWDYQKDLPLEPVHASHLVRCSVCSGYGWLDFVSTNL